MNKLTTLGEEVSEGAGSDPEDEDDIDSQQSDGDSGVFNRQFPSSHNAYPSQKTSKMCFTNNRLTSLRGIFF